MWYTMTMRECATAIAARRFRNNEELEKHIMRLITRRAH
jgi:hypothetical protein